MEADHKVSVLVEVETYGHEEKVMGEILHMVARECALQIGDEQVRVMAYSLDGLLVSGRWLRYDRFGDDQGHHPGHEEPLVPS